MQTYIILLRGINVGGNNIVSMKALTEALNEAGYSQVSTYIQCIVISVSSSQALMKLALRNLPAAQSSTTSKARSCTCTPPMA
jgi:uncharacterized protein (DUF1697 family)